MYEILGHCNAILPITLCGILPHVVVISCIMYVLTSGFTFFLRLRGTADFSYMAIVIFGAYAGAILATSGWHPLYAFLGAYVLSIIFTIVILRIIKRLNVIYFNIGTFSLYILAGYLTSNLAITGGTNGMSTGFLANDFGWKQADFVNNYVLIAIGVVIFVLLFYHTFFYRVLTGWGEHENSTKALGVQGSRYAFVLILVTSFLAVLGGNMHAWALLYLSPSSFWIPFLILLMATTYSSYLFREVGTLVMTFLLMYVYELFRYAKFVDVSRIGYLREMMFAIMVMIIVFFVFQKVRFAREH